VILGYAGGASVNPAPFLQIARNTATSRETSKKGIGDVFMILYLFAVLVLGLMCGSELNVAAFAHPALEGQRPELRILLRSSFARLFGRVMPFWMAGSTLLNLLLLLPSEHLNKSARHLAAIPLAIQVFAVVFSLVGPVPINNRSAKWTPESVPDDWMALERWDAYHWIRTSALIVAFALLVLCFGLGWNREHRFIAVLC
jgi:uncharacterized membrane protein